MKNYWDKFYQENKISKQPSTFARFVKKYIKKDNLVVYCLGVGNGRDAYYLGKKWKVFGIDYAFEPSQKYNAIFLKASVEGYIKKFEFSGDMIYARFFFHHTTDEIFNKILKWGKGLLAFEVRSKKDEELDHIFEHQRYYRTGNEILDLLFKNGYELMYFQESRGLARFRNEDPWIIRIIAKKYEINK